MDVHELVEFRAVTVDVQVVVVFHAEIPSLGTPLVDLAPVSDDQEPVELCVGNGPRGELSIVEGPLVIHGDDVGLIELTSIVELKPVPVVVPAGRERGG